ncbi:DUF397 domain-containing protein [Streptomyces silvensis]|uniref:DUF397 domain-containing protein n=1 Tax=Streptomyces silvensis TaxID=1765722 RepID=A0A0W7WW36_9ACTN|nr:DUF397 domain-containing protein [Streptomyces silvensis]KUF14794.1 DUF397 domain-containing protein [Streptomyces silvensis]
MTAFDFRKSTHSGGEPHSECVEVATNIPGTVAIRDSKDPDPDTPIVRLAPTAWTRFTASLR